MIKLPNYTKDEIKEMDNDFGEGVYDFKVLNFENKRSKNSGKMMTEITFVFDGPNFEFNQWEYFVHSQITDTNNRMHGFIIKKISEFLESIELKYSENVFNAETIVGKQGQAYVHMLKKKGEDKAKRVIKHFITKCEEIPEVVLPEKQAPAELSPNNYTKPEKTITRNTEFDDDIPF